jgi:hypothetical protein
VFRILCVWPANGKFVFRLADAPLVLFAALDFLMSEGEHWPMHKTSTVCCAGFAADADADADADGDGEVGLALEASMQRDARMVASGEATQEDLYFFSWLRASVLPLDLTMLVPDDFSASGVAG